MSSHLNKLENFIMKMVETCVTEEYVMLGKLRLCNSLMISRKHELSAKGKMLLKVRAHAAYVR